jgi:tRNA dimethylallyltransferase
MNEPIIVITGPTASGKTSKAAALAKRMRAEIISADSRQVYKGMDIGTGKDLDEYGDVPYHLIDICPAGYKYNLYEFLRDYYIAYDEIRKRGRDVILCGGTGLYIEAVIKGLQLPKVPENKELRSFLQDKSLENLTEILRSYKSLHNSTDVDSAKRAIRAIEIQKYYQENPELGTQTEPNPIDAVVVCIDIDRDSRRRRISQRLRQRLNQGMVDEVARLITDEGLTPDDLIYYGLEYKFITRYLVNEITYEEMVKGLEIAIHQFAKRQMTWFRGMERRGIKVHWVPYDMDIDEFTSKVVEWKNSYCRT